MGKTWKALTLCGAQGTCILGRQPVCPASTDASNASSSADFQNTDSDESGFEQDAGSSEQSSSNDAAAFGPDAGTSGHEYFEPGCDERPTIFEPGYYTPCETAGQACASGGWCHVVSINPCVCGRRLLRRVWSRTGVVFRSSPERRGYSVG
jgi:hypothetical protein